MSAPPKTFVTPEEYLELERKSEFRAEYINGEIFAMAGASRVHDGIAMQLGSLVHQHVKGRKCRAFTANMRVLAAPSGVYTYPDLSVVCGEPRFAGADVDTLTNPTLLVEILSPSTKDYDRGTKAKLYRAMPSLQELLFIAQDAYDVDLYRLQSDGSWRLFVANRLEASVELVSIGYTLHLRELYETVLESIT